MIERTSGSGSNRILILLRHAKAEQGEIGLADIDRPLAADGKIAARAAGAWLGSHGVLPEQVLCSPSRRTRETWEGVGQGIGQAGDDDLPTVRYESVIYDGAAFDVLNLLRQVTSGTKTLLLIGHNPTVSELSNLLDPMQAAADWLGTCDMVVHQLDGDWGDLRPGAAPIRRRYVARAA